MKISICIVLNILINASLFGQKSNSVSASAKVIDGMVGISYGVDFALVHLETGKIYYSRILSIFKQRHSIIESLPDGKYYIFYFSSKSMVEPPNHPIHEYFGYLEFEGGKNYYLGNFIGRIKVGRDKPLVYTLKDGDIPKKLLKTLKGRKLLERGEKLIKIYPYQLDSLVIESKPLH